MNEQSPRTVAFFDFDATLSKGDSLWPFLVAAAGWPRCILALFAGAGAYLLALVHPGMDRRTAIKDALLHVTMRGLKVAELGPAIERMKRWPRWLEPAHSALLEHHAKGHTIVIATGSLDLYVPQMLGDLPYDAILCTQMENVDGRLTGRMLSGNCVRGRKAQLVEEYLAEEGPFEDSYAYGNAPHDLPMMLHVRHGIII